MTASPRNSLLRDRLLPVFAVAAFAQTLFYYRLLRDDPGNYNGAGALGDQVEYINLAHQILRGDWQGAGHYMPGYPAFLALGESLFRDPVLGAAILQGLLYVVLVYAVAWLARDAFGPATGRWAAAFVALDPALGAYAGQALTEFVTGALLVLLAVLVHRWGRDGRLRWAVGAGIALSALAYVRSEYLGLAALMAIVVLLIARRSEPLRRAWRPAVALAAVVVVAIVPWLVREDLATGTPGLHNVSPVSNLVLMGTWFRVFDDHTFAQLQQIEKSSASRDEAVAEAGKVGPRPELSARYMAQTRGPYDLPLGETLRLATENIRLNLPQYLVNHFVLAPVLIWGGRTPVRQADLTAVPGTVRWALWGAQLALFLLALWQAVRGLRDRSSLALSATLLTVVVFLSAIHLFIAVDERFTEPALPLLQAFAGIAVARLVAAWRARTAVSPSYARA